MDESLAKGLTKRFFRDYIFETGVIGSILSNHSKKRSNRIDFWLTEVRRKASHCLIHSAKFGTKKRVGAGWSLLLGSRYNEAKDWEESVMYPYDYVFVNNKLQEDNQPFWCISHHAIQRIFQRKIGAETSDLKELVSCVTAELRFVTLISYVLNRAFSRVLRGFPLDEHDDFDLICPTDNGLFLCELNFLEGDTGIIPQLQLRSWISLDMLRPEQLESRERLMKRASPFTEMHLIYLINNDYHIYYDQTPSTENYRRAEFIIYSLLMLEFITEFDSLFASRPSYSQKLEKVFSEAMFLRDSPFQSLFQEAVTSLGWEAGYPAVFKGLFKGFVRDGRSGSAAINIYDKSG